MPCGLRERSQGKGTVGKVALRHVQETLRNATLNSLFPGQNPARGDRSSMGATGGVNQRLTFSELRDRSLSLGPCDQAIELLIARVNMVEKKIELPRGFAEVLAE